MGAVTAQARRPFLMALLPLAATASSLMPGRARAGPGDRKVKIGVFIMGIIELIALQFLVSVPALIIAQGVAVRH